jgi:hypothetical protein
MSKRISRQRLWWLLPVACAGVITLLASSTFEEDPPRTTTTVDRVTPTPHRRADRAINADDQSSSPGVPT